MPGGLGMEQGYLSTTSEKPFLSGFQETDDWGIENGVLHLDRNNKRSKLIYIYSVSVIAAIFIIAIISRDPFSKSYNNILLTENEDLSLEIQNEYPSLSSLPYYPWDYIAEPHKVSTLRISNNIEGAEYIWTIIDSENNILVENVVGSEISAIFTKAGSYYTIDVMETQKGNRRFNAQIICKYVRREIRDLTDDDLENFMYALKIFHEISLDEGRKLYGSQFFTYKELTRLHLQENMVGESSAKTCSPWHTGPTFISSHLALLLWVEQNLQRIVPSVSIPHWDYVWDSLKYGTDWSVESPIFSDQLFGAYNDDPFDLTGYWEDTPLATVTASEDESARYNSYHILTDWHNNDPATTVHRSDEVCGWKFENIGLPSCAEVTSVLDKKSLSGVKNYMEFGLHGRLHVLLGGVWDCKQDFGSLKDEFEEDQDAQLATEGILSIAASLYAKLYSEGLYSSPGECDPDVPFEDCRFTCSSFDFEDIDNMSNDEIYDYLNDWGLFDIYNFNQMYQKAVDGTMRVVDEKYMFVDVDGPTDAKLKKYMLKLACGPGKLSPFTSPLAATNDPIFVSTHSFHQLYWSYLLLSNSEFEYLKWDDEIDCYGHHLNDTMAWYGFLGEDLIVGSEYHYTNADILEMFHPTNADLPYIHDSFDSVTRCSHGPNTNGQSKKGDY